MHFSFLTIAILLLVISGLVGTLALFKATRSIALILAGSILLMLSLFCIYGFLATFEPTANAFSWRIGYTIAFFTFLVLGSGCLTWSIRTRKRS